MKYLVIEETHLQALIHTIEKLLTEGWKLKGGISHGMCGGGGVICN